ncbi:hypothetical protein [Microbacterium sp. NPDC055665]
MTRRLHAALAALLVVLGSGVPAVAVADDSDAIEVSDDGTVYTVSIDGLFAGTTLVPLSQAVDHFSVRNRATKPVYLRIVLTDVVTTDSVLRDALSLDLSSPGGQSTTVPFSTRECVEVVAGYPLEIGESTTFDAALALGDLPGVEGQSESTAFSLHIVATNEPEFPGRYTCATAATAPPPAPPLPGTGGTVPLAWISAAAALVGVGIGATLWARRRHNPGGDDD